MATQARQSSSAEQKRMKKTSVPGVYKRGNRYVYKYRDQHGVQRQGSASSLREARRLKESAGAAVREGRHQVQSSARFDDYARQVLSEYAGRTDSGFRETSRNSYSDILENHIIPFFRGRKLTTIGRKDVSAFMRHMNKKPHPYKPGRLLSKSTITYVMRVLKIVLAVAAEEGDLTENPASYVRVTVSHGPGGGREPGAQRRPRALTREQLAAFLDALPTDRDRRMFRFLTATGLRIGELQELRFKDIEFGDHPQVRVRRQYAYLRGVGPTVNDPKTEYGIRDIPLPRGLASELELMRTGPEDLVWPNTVGTYLSRHNYSRKVLKPAARAAGVGWASFHTFRHTCASLLFARGSDPGGEDGSGGWKNVKQVQVWLGHSTPGFTLDRYIHLLDDGLGDADFFDQML